MAENIYESLYTGNQVDNATRDKVVATTLSEIEAMNYNATTISTSKIYIAVDDNTLWRCNGFKMVQIGVGAIVNPITDGDTEYLTGLVINTKTYKINHISIQDDELKITN